MALAYDPLADEDVEIGDCHPVHAADDADDLSESVVKIMSRDFRHDPCEGCQGFYSLLVAHECDECGCNRAEKSADSLAGVMTLRCSACDEVHERA